LENVDVNVRILKWIMKKRNEKCLPHLFDFRHGPVSGFCEHGNEILSEKFLDKMSN
jgi:hypothetical protein